MAPLAQSETESKMSDTRSLTDRRIGRIQARTQIASKTVVLRILQTLQKKESLEERLKYNDKDLDNGQGRAELRLAISKDTLT